MVSIYYSVVMIGLPPTPIIIGEAGIDSPSWYFKAGAYAQSVDTDDPMECVAVELRELMHRAHSSITRGRLRIDGANRRRAAAAEKGAKRGEC